MALRTVPSATEEPTVAVSRVIGVSPVIFANSASTTSLPSFPKSLVRTKYCPSPKSWTIASGWPLAMSASLTASVPGSSLPKSYVELVPDTKSMPRLRPGANSKTTDITAMVADIGRNILRSATKSIVLFLCPSGLRPRIRHWYKHVGGVANTCASDKPQHQPTGEKCREHAQKHPDAQR